MKKLSLYIFLVLFSLTNISKAEVYLKCDLIEGNIVEESLWHYEYLMLSIQYIKNSTTYKKFYYSWDKKEQKFNDKGDYKTRKQDYTIYGIWLSGKKNRATIDRETGILYLLDNKFQCNKIDESDLPIIEIEQKF